MPYKNDLRKTVTLNLPADEHAALSAEARAAGYASAGTYALALVRARGKVLVPRVAARAPLLSRPGPAEWPSRPAKRQARGGPVPPGAGPADNALVRREPTPAPAETGGRAPAPE